MTDSLDEPQPDGYSLVYPFVVCASHGGPYDDNAFVAGVQLGRIDQALETATVLGVDRLSFTVFTTLVHQLELVGMARGFPIVTATEVGETAEHAAMPQWSHVTFERSAHS